MSRRSQSPEGVGDLLKQDSFGGFEDDDPMNDSMETDILRNGTADSLYKSAAKDAQSEDADMHGNNDANEGAAAISRPNITRIPVPSFTGVSSDGGINASAPRTAGGRGPARYFIVKSNNTGNIDHSIKNGIWATQVCH